MIQLLYNKQKEGMGIVIRNWSKIAVNWKRIIKKCLNNAQNSLRSTDILLPFISSWKRYSFFRFFSKCFWSTSFWTPPTSSGASQSFGNLPWRESIGATMDFFQGLQRIIFGENCSNWPIQVTFCDLKTRDIGQFREHTVQCVLMINMCLSLVLWHFQLIYTFL